MLDDFSQRASSGASSGWLEFRSVDPGSGYVYSGTTLGVLKIKLDESVKAGDVIDLSAVSISPTGAVATVEIADGSRSSPAITLLLSIPTVVFSFYGMNTNLLPMSDSWVFPMLLSVALAAVAVVALLRWRR